MGGRGSSAGSGSSANANTINLTSGTTGQRFTSVQNLESAIENSGYEVFDSSGSLKNGALYANDLNDRAFSVNVKYRSNGDQIEVYEIKGQ